MKALVLSLSLPRYLLYQVVKKFFGKKYIMSLSGLAYSEVPRPKIIDQDWVLIKTLKASICGSDLNTIGADESTTIEPYASFPSILGHEGVGEVVELGSNVNEVSLGDCVVVDPILSCRVRGIDPLCPSCAEGKNAQCENFRKGKLSPSVSRGFCKEVPGCFGEYFLAHRSQCIKVPQEVSVNQAVMVDAIASSLDPAINFYPEESARVLIYGCGTIGLNLIQCLRALGFGGDILVVYKYSQQADMARKFGATHCIASRENLLEKVKEIYGFELLKPLGAKPFVIPGIEQVYDCVGSQKSLNQSLRLLAGRGKYILVATSGVIKNIDISFVWFKELYISGSSMYSVPYKGKRLSALGKKSLDDVIGKDSQGLSSYQLAIELLRLGKVDGESLITHNFSLNEFKKAFECAFDKKKSKSIKVCFDF